MCHGENEERSDWRFGPKRKCRFELTAVSFRRSFGPHKCCHPQISDLGFIISWWQLSCEIFLQILTSLELHSNSANRPGILLSHDGSLEVNLLMIFLELSLKKTSRMTKSDICGWQHLRVPKYLLDLPLQGSPLNKARRGAHARVSAPVPRTLALNQPRIVQ